MIGAINEMQPTGSDKQQMVIKRRKDAGWKFLHWTDIPEGIAVMEASNGKLAYINPDGFVLLRGEGKSLWEPAEARKAHLWRIRKEGFIEFLRKKGWYVMGAYAVKVAAHGEIMLRRVEEGPDYYLCKIQYKSDFWIELMAEHDGKGDEAHV